MLTFFFCAAGAQAVSASQPLQLDTLIPDPHVWMNEILYKLGSANAMGAISDFSLVVCAAVVVFGLWGAWIKRSAGVALRLLVIGGVSASMIQSLGHHGYATGIPKMVYTSWETAYNGSNAAARRIMPGNIERDAHNLALAFGTYVAQATLSSRTIATINFDSITTDPAVNTGLAATASTTALQSGNQAASTIAAQSWVVIGAYLLLLSLFVVYAGLIILMGGTLLLTFFALPLALAVLPMGNSSALMKLLFGWIASIISAALLPFMFVVVTGLSLQLPQQALQRMVDTQNTQMGQLVTDYVQQAAACKARLGFQLVDATTCTTLATAKDRLMESASNTFSVLMAALVTVVVTLIGMGVAGALLRAVPGTLGSILGSIGLEGRGLQGSPLASAMRLGGQAASLAGGAAAAGLKAGGGALVGAATGGPRALAAVAGGVSGGALGVGAASTMAASRGGDSQRAQKAQLGGGGRSGGSGGSGSGGSGSGGGPGGSGTSGSSFSSVGPASASSGSTGGSSAGSSAVGGTGMGTASSRPGAGSGPASSGGATGASGGGAAQPATAGGTSGQRAQRSAPPSGGAAPTVPPLTWQQAQKQVREGTVVGRALDATQQVAQRYLNRTSGDPQVRKQQAAQDAKSKEQQTGKGLQEREAAIAAQEALIRGEAPLGLEHEKSS
ncbi:hypothetical protein [Deinococcus sonorensis]|uniref:Conjugal transfer protein TrbL n=1 Tax=Deinococcus sonorensis TaxID=309891 RepID=A0ABV8YB90_9DEIO